MFQPIRIKGTNVGSLDDFEYSFENGCTVVQSENKDDSAQESNGGGKSTFLDITGICLLGTSLLGKSPKDIINWNPDIDSMEVEFEMDNKMTNQNVIIKRKLYKSKSKSEELSILVNGELPKSLPTKKGFEDCVDVKEGNKYILESILDITKENILNRYLISTGNDYTSFFEITGKKKLEFVEQFSKTEKIDEAIGKMETKKTSIESKISDCEDREIDKKSKIEVFLGQIDRIQNGEASKSFEEDKLSKINELELSIEKNKDYIKNCESIISSEGNNINDQKLLITPIKNKIVELNASVEKLLSKRELIAQESNPFESKLDELNNKKSSLLDESGNISKEKSESLLLKGELEGYKKSSVQCPACDHKFISTKTDLSLEEVELMISEVSNSIEELSNQFALCKSKIDSIDTDEVSKQKSSWSADQSEKIKEVDGEIRLVNSEIQSSESELNNINNQISTLTSRVENNKERIESLIIDQHKLIESVDKINQSKYNGEGEIDRLLKESESIESQLNEIEKEKEELEKELSIYNQWIINYKDFKFYVINKRIQSIAGHINYYLQQNGSDLSISIDGFKQLRSGDIKQEFNVMVYRNGDNPQPYTQFSGGERARLNLSSDLAFQELINANSVSGGLNYYQSDELLNPVDSTGISYAAKAFDSLSKPILLATHSGKDLNYSKTLFIVKQNGISKIQ